MFFLPRKKDFGFVKLCIKNNVEVQERRKIQQMEDLRSFEISLNMVIL